MLRGALTTWEIAAPCTFLVSSTVKCSLWPNTLRSGGKAFSFKTGRALIQHNGSVLIESGPVGWIACHLKRRSLFVAIRPTWFMSSHWVPPTPTTAAPRGRADTSGSCSARDGAATTRGDRPNPQFIYFFLDTTLPGWFVTIAILALLAVLLIFYAVFCSAEVLLATLPGGWLTNFIFVGGGCFFTMRLQQTNEWIAKTSDTDNFRRS